MTFTKKSPYPFSRWARSALLAAVLSVWAGRTEAALTHRYSFSNGVTDSVGGANGTVQGGVTIADGVATFPGASNTDYIELPSGLITNYTSVTFEMWVNVLDNGTWTEIYALGNQTAGGEGANMVMFCPHTGSTVPDFRMSYAQSAPGYNDERVANGVGILDNVGPVSVTCVYDPPNGAMTLYTNGTFVATLSPVPSANGKSFSLTNVYDVHAWLGRSLYNADAPYNGSIDEFRVYNSALSPLQVYVNNAAGPDTIVTNIAINSLSWNVQSNMVVGSRQSSTVTFNTASYGSVTVPGATEPTYVSGDANVVSVTAQGQLFARTVGSATVSAVYNGTTNSAVVTVTAPVLVHRYSFAADANDSVGTAHGKLVNGASITGGAVVLPGGTPSSDPTSAYVDLPNGLLTNLTAATFEAWVTDNESGAWARIWDFGNSSDGEDAPNSGVRWVYGGINNSGNLLGSIHVNDRGGDSAVETPRPASGQKTHVVWSSDIANHTSWLYLNGSLKAVNTTTIVSPADIGPSLNNWLGRSQFAGDPTFSGSIDEFRIYNGALSALQVALDAAAGPDQIVTDPGAIQALRVVTTTNKVSYGGGFVTAAAYADYTTLTNVPIPAAFVTFGSSNPNVLTVDQSGRLHDVSLGTANVTVTYGGKTAEAAVTIVGLANPETATLVHRYSFSEAAGATTVDDSVGTADGTIKGTGATLGGGQLTLPGGTGSAADPIAGYVDLPNHIINVLSNISVEAWVTWQGSGSWQRIFDFGTSAGGEDVSDGNGGYLFLAPQGAANLAFSVRDPIAGAEPAPLIGGAPIPANQEVFLAVVYDFTDNVARLYSNSVAVVAGAAPVDLTTIDDVNNWLGRSQWNDPTFQGKLNEFRIWKGVLLPEQIAAHYAAGPDSMDSLPKLAAAVTGQNLVISWAASATGFVLESSPTLGTGATWTAVTPAPTTNNGTSSVTVPIGPGAQFYRLRKT